MSEDNANLLVDLINKTAENKFNEMSRTSQLLTLKVATISEYDASTERAKVYFPNDSINSSSWYFNRSGAPLQVGQKVYIYHKYGDVEQGFIVISGDNNLSQQGYTGSRGSQGYTGSVGYVGSQGLIGFTGSQGIQGIQGYTGSQGVQGVIGYTGSQGIQGYTGSQGIQGVQGFTGSQGIQGVIGYTGSRGYTGSQGIQGIQGFTGSQGIQGLIGYTGSQGIQGIQGIQGYTGSQGIQGYTGSQGDQGIIGYTGSASTVIGYTGSQGNQGNIGYTGSASTVIGYTGSQGLQGYTGSASTVIGYTGSQGVIGYTGSASTVVGYTGSQGIQGIQGFTGSQGIQGTIGYTGSKGDQGIIGYTGSASTVIGYTGSRGVTGYTGSASTVIGYTGSASTIPGYTGSAGAGYTGSMGYTGSKGSTINGISTIPTTGWAANTGDFPYYVNVPLVGILNTDIVNVIIDKDYLDSSSACGLSGTVETYTSGIIFYSTTVPTIAIPFTWTSVMTGTSVTTGYTGSQGVQGLTGYTGSGSNADTLDGVHGVGYARAYPIYSFGNAQTAITTAQFITLLSSLGAFDQTHWTSRGTWSYAANQYINDTGVGNIHLAGCTVETIGNSSEYTIRIHTPTTTANGAINSDYIYVNNGVSYSPGWRKLIAMTNIANSDGMFDNTATAPTGTSRLNYSGYLYATRVYNAVYNDYAEFFEKGEETEPGDILMIDYNSDVEKYIKASGEKTTFVVGVHSDEYGHCLGGKGDGNDEEDFIPIGLSGRLRVKIIGLIKKGDYVVVSKYDGVGRRVYDGEDVPNGATIGMALEDKDFEEISRVRILIKNI